MTQHLSHLLMLGLPLLAFVLILWGEWQRTAAVPVPLALVRRGVAGLGAGVLHAGVIGHHLGESALLGAFFALLAATQVGLALSLLFGARSVVQLSVFVQGGVVCLWLWTRTVGIPFGLAGGRREEIGVLDLLCTALELTAIGLAYGVKVEPRSKWLTSTTMNSPRLVKVRVPDGSRPSQVTQSLRPSRESTVATRS
jgi:hypothetical protein